MITRVVERTFDAEHASRVLVGHPIDKVPAGRACTWLFAEGEIVAYQVRPHAHAKLFVFRTLTRPEPIASHVPGVLPQVRLLIVTHGERRMRRALQIMWALEQRGTSPRAAPDDFFLRAAMTLAGRADPRDLVSSLLAAGRG